MMNQLQKSTEVRKNWSEFIDGVVREKPSLFRRNRDTLSVLSLDQLNFLLEGYHLTLKILSEEDGTFTGILEELDLLANETNEIELVNTIICDLMEYANEYMDNFAMYFNSPNRKKHFPYVYKAISQSESRSLVREDFTIYRTDEHA